VETPESTKPRILVINDDPYLLASRKLLLEDCGAEVVTARGAMEAIKDALSERYELAVIDVTNVGTEYGEKICAMVKTIHPTVCVALLATPELGLPASSHADRVIYRGDPRSLLVELNELLKGRLNLSP
jgi:CheY-like chemotaxis protein